MGTGARRVLRSRAPGTRNQPAHTAGVAMGAAPGGVPSIRAAEPGQGPGRDLIGAHRTGTGFGTGWAGWSWSPAPPCTASSWRTSPYGWYWRTATRGGCSTGWGAHPGADLPVRAHRGRRPATGRAGRRAAQPCPVHPSGAARRPPGRGVAGQARRATADFYTMNPPELAGDPGRDGGTLVFVATMSSAADVDGIHFLLDDVFPLLLRARAAHPGGHRRPCPARVAVREDQGSRPRRHSDRLRRRIRRMSPRACQRDPAVRRQRHTHKGVRGDGDGPAGGSTTIGVEGLDVADGENVLCADEVRHLPAASWRCWTMRRCAAGSRRRRGGWWRTASRGRSSRVSSRRSVCGPCNEGGEKWRYNSPRFHTRYVNELGVAEHDGPH